MVTFFVGDGIHTAPAFTSSGRELAITVAGHEQVLEAFAILGMDEEIVLEVLFGVKKEER